MTNIILSLSTCLRFSKTAHPTALFRLAGLALAAILVVLIPDTAAAQCYLPNANTLSCGDSIVEIPDGSNDSDLYSCSSTTYPRHDKSYILNPPTNSEVQIDITNGAGQQKHSLIIEQDACGEGSAGTCIFEGLPGVDATSFISDGNPYYVTIDSNQNKANDNNYLLEVTCYNECPANAIYGEITCSDDIIGLETGTGASSDSLDFYECGDPYANLAQTNEEYIFTFTPQQTGSVTFIIDNLTQDFDLYVLEDYCLQSACVGSSTGASVDVDTVTFDAEVGSTYYVVVESFAGGVNQSFDLHFDAGTVGCPEDCNNGIDDDVDCTSDSDGDGNFCDEGDDNVDCLDSDCLGDPNCCDIDLDTFLHSSPECGGDDCNDLDSAINVNAIEICDGVDNDCDGLIDDDDPNSIGNTTWYLDDDGDGFGDSGQPTDSCAQPSINHVLDDTDCDDADANNYPGNTEICDGQDNDCDGLIDDADPGASGTVNWYLDDDGDGFGDASLPTVACTQPSPDHVIDNTDCDDADANNYPGNTEVCDGQDNDCDGLIDDADPTIAGQATYFADNDGDGYGDSLTDIQACDQPADTVLNDQDCDDTDPNNYPTNTEICDGQDNDCDGLVDDDDAGVSGQAEWYLDGDNDNFGDAAQTIMECYQPAGYVADDTDCDDNDPNNYPTNTEICDGQDNDCDGLVDDDDTGVSGTATWYQDSDSDNYGDTLVTVDECSQPAGYVADNTDCDDNDPNNYPTNTEICDGQDNDCDFLVDDDDTDIVSTNTWYADSDGDNYGDDTQVSSECTQPADTVTDNTDCDDTDDTIYPGAPEICDGKDNDCDFLIDDDDPDAIGEPLWYQDSDNDNFGDSNVSLEECIQPAGYVSDDTDCDDNDPNNYPGNTEVCDGQDNDCDFLIDDDDPGITGQSSWYRDSDGDSYGDPGISTPECNQPAGFVADNTDCDDNDSNNYPTNTEICDGQDNDCDNLVDDDDPDVSGGSTWYQDDDGDGYGQTAATTDACDEPAGYTASPDDCDDNNDTVYPGAPELCDGIDNDCDFLVDDDDPDALGQSAWYLDNDGDSFGDASQTVMDCIQPPGYVLNDTDCDDNDVNNYPTNDEICDGQDNDCDFLVDDDDPSLTGQPTWYADVDGDNFGDASQFMDACQQPADHTADDTDCDDNDPNNYPTNTEICDGQDNDCDTLIDDADPDINGQSSWYLDSDGDSYGDAGQPVDACDQPANHVADDTDCDDNDANNFPTNTEICDGQDNDCDNLIDDADPDVIGQATWYLDSDGDDYGDVDQVSNQCTQPGGYVGDDTDCDDNDPNNYPTNTEICDGQDNDCDNLIDDADPDITGTSTWYLDNDGDTYGDAFQFLDECTQPTGYVADDTDCDDADDNNYPTNTEICDGQDNDCDNLIDDLDPNIIGQSLWYYDSDGDGYGDVSSTLDECTQPTDYVANDTDCDDTDAAINPAATEICDGLDNNCDGNIDEGLLTAYYEDKDSDGYGETVSVVYECTQPAGYVVLDSDCDDINAQVYPGAPELCDGIDNDCDGAIDEGVPPTWYFDGDGDGHGQAGIAQTDCVQPTGYVLFPDDCDDLDANNYPSNTEVCDLQDNDCDTLIDEGVTAFFYEDSDGDGYGNDAVSVDECSAPTGYTSDDTDCDDTENTVYPGAPEICDGLDNNCDGVIDEGVLGSYFPDLDGDGFGDAAGVVSECNKPFGYVNDSTDCDDDDANNNPLNLEVCDGQDNDCDSLVDDADPSVTGQSTWYTDADGDSYGDANASILACDQPTNGVADDTDCDDSEVTTYPGADEYCDGVDNDCNGVIDDDYALDALVWYTDGDGDGYGDATDSALSCNQPTDGVADDTDCDDGDNTVYPGAPEYCDGIDNDCNGVIDDSYAAGGQTWYADADADGYGDASVSVDACDQPADHVLDDTDCDDTDDTIYPGATEIPYDGIDQDCDGLDEDDLDGDGYPGGPNGTDCNDYDDTVNPAMTEHADGRDEDCDGIVDEGTVNYDDDDDGYAENGGDCNDGDDTIYPNAPETCNGVDDDCDGIIDNNSECYDDDGDCFCEVGPCVGSIEPTCVTLDGGDCNDGDINVWPGDPSGSDEIANNGIDDDCDGVVDTLVNDPDQDGYTPEGGDCDNMDPSIYPGATEQLNGVDDDCDGIIDEDTSAYDDDGDCYCEIAPCVGSINPACATILGGDCADADVTRNPGAPEAENGIDDDCDGTIDEDTDRSDDDGDGFSEYDGDCDDTKDSIYPNAPEVENGIDDDCDEEIDEDFLDQDDDGFDGSTDCDDTNGWVNPEMKELCGDGIDNNCNDEVDEECDTGTVFGDPITEECGCSATGLGSVGYLSWLLLGFAGMRRKEQPTPR